MKLNNTTTPQPLQTTRTPPANSTSKKAVGQLPPKDSIQSRSYCCCNPIADFFWSIINFFKGLFGCVSKTEEKPFDQQQFINHLVEAKNAGYNTPEYNRHLQSAIDLITPKSNLDIEIPTKSGSMPFLFFIIYNAKYGIRDDLLHTLIKKALETKSIDLERKHNPFNDKYQTALEYALATMKPELASLLFKHGAIDDSRTIFWYLQIKQAIAEGHVNEKMGDSPLIVKILKDFFSDDCSFLIDDILLNEQLDLDIKCDLYNSGEERSLLEIVLNQILTFGHYRTFFPHCFRSHLNLLRKIAEQNAASISPHDLETAIQHAKKSFDPAKLHTDLYEANALRQELVTLLESIKQKQGIYEIR